MSAILTSNMSSSAAEVETPEINLVVETPERSITQYVLRLMMTWMWSQNV